MDNLNITVNFKDIEFQERIGTGSFGIVHKALWKPSDEDDCQIIAVKKNYVQEYSIIQILEKCVHKNIITFYGVTRDPDDIISLLFEYADCGSLYNVLHYTDKDVSFKEKLHWMQQCAQGMEYLHNKNIIHGDLKPQNLLLFNEYQTLKICDFGIVRESATMNSEYIGTVSYTAPELCNSTGKYNEKCDVFSFGIILWEVMSRKKPFYDFNPLIIQKLIVDGYRPNVDDMMMHADSDNIKPLTVKCWNPLPQNRPTMHELRVLFSCYPLASIDVNFADIELGAIIEQGSYSVVHKATWKTAGQVNEFAIKIIKNHYEDSKTKMIFLREIRNVTKFNHTNIVTLYGTSIRPDNSICLLFEYADCGPLYNCLHQTDKEVSFKDKLDWMQQCAKGMEYLHSKNIFHRNLKTKNLLLFNGYRILKISGFGNAKEYQTMNTEFIGTVCYMAPEVCSSTGKYNEKCDVFSFGIILWEVMSRKKPFYELIDYNQFAILYQIMNGARPNINDANIHDESDYIGPIIEKCWDHVPENRLTMQELCVLLHPDISNINFDEIKSYEFIARGSYGDVHKAIWKPPEVKGIPIAVKTIQVGIQSEVSETETINFEKDVLREMQRRKKYAHQNIITLYGISKGPNYSICLILEYADCGSLSNFLHHTEKEVSFKEKLDWMQQCAQGIEFLHSKNIVHGDLKTKNLLLFNEYRTLKISDFGRGTEFGKIDTELVETVCYKAPEVCKIKGKYNKKCDVFSFGIILWEVISRKKPFDELNENNPEDIKQKIAAGNRPDINDAKMNDLSSYIGSTIEKCWDHNPDNRPTMKDLKELCALLPVYLLNTPAYKKINFNEIQLGAFIGRGSYGVVHQAIWKLPEQKDLPIAVKILEDRSQDSITEKIKFEMDVFQEIYNLNKFKHPNIITLYGVTKDPDNIWLLFEYADCKSLCNFLHYTEKEVSCKRKLDWMLQCAKGMEYLHNKKIIHRDLKTENLLLFNDYRVLKVCDFGTVKELTTMKKQSTIFYMAPEVYNGHENYKEKCDVFSFGIIFWEVMSRKKPYYELNSFHQFAIINKILNGTRPNINDIMIDEDSNPIKSLIENCWASDPINRPTMQELCVLLSKFG